MDQKVQAVIEDLDKKGKLLEKLSKSLVLPGKNKEAQALIARSGIEVAMEANELLLSIKNHAPNLIDHIMMLCGALHMFEAYQNVEDDQARVLKSPESADQNVKDDPVY